ncbi:MAG: hypothetical protein IMF17_02400, partial [Proteobacteria bacterium]|nr:hypothetical protein [Pseudomonadota bacterium]
MKGKISIRNRSLLAKLLIAGSVFLWPMQSVYAAANLILATGFTPAQTGRIYMDTGGTWDGSNDAAGDIFSFTIDNTGPDSAFDIRDIAVAIPSGFILGQVSVAVTDSPASCTNINGITANQTGPNQIVIGIPADTDIAANCSYRFDLVMTTNSTVTTNPAHTVTFSSSYNEIDDNNGSQQLFSASESIAVRAGGLSLTKTTTEFNPIDNTVVTFDVVIQNTGTGGLFDVRLSDLLGSGLINLNIIVPPTAPTGSLISPTEYEFNYIPGGTTVNVTVEARTDYNPVPAVCPTLTNTASIVDRTAIIVPDSIATIPFDMGALTVSHLGASRCVLCGTGTVTLLLNNTSAIDINNLVISEDLLASELRVLNSTSTFGGSPIADPSRTGTVYTWALAAAVSVPANSTRELVFDVSYDTTLGINEDLAGNNTSIQASVDYTLSCGTTQPAVNDLHSLVLDQPLPQVTKQGRNVDAAQGAGSYTDTVFGHRDDDVIWRVQIQNTGPVDLEDVLLNDTITGNFDITHVCPSEATANSVATGGSPAGCSNTGGGVVTTVNNFLMNNPFGATGSTDVVAGTTEDIFYVGKIRNSCGVETNNVDIEWGCDVDTPPSGPGGLNSAAILAGGTID